MSVFIKKLPWRGLTSLAVAYALVLQVFLAYSIATQAAAQDASAYAGDFFVICSSHSGSAADRDAGAPIKPNTHCPICTLAFSDAALLPDPVALPAQRPGIAARMSFVSAEACLSFHRARAGLSRAPPQNA